jgi:hypothetical protein
MEACRTAISSGNEAAVKQCIDLGNQATQAGVVEKALGKEGQKQLMSYIALGGAVYLGVLLLPSITQSVLTTQQVVSERRK